MISLVLLLVWFAKIGYEINIVLEPVIDFITGVMCGYRVDFTTLKCSLSEELKSAFFS